MRIVVAPHDLTMGGSQINAIDLAAGVRDLGHEVVVWGGPGPLTEHIERRGLEFVPAPTQAYRPAPQRMAHLLRLARRRRIDLIHGYEWPPCLDAYFGALLVGRVPVVCTVLSMAVSPLVPRSLPLIMGTEALADDARRAGFQKVSVGEPPIDTVGDHPGIDGGEIRRQLGVAPCEELVVTVSRLSIDLKLDALEAAIDAVGRLAGRRPVRLVLVGGGEAEAQLRQRAEAVNAAHGREVVTLVGERLDPRPWYAAADVVVGMGSSALRAMAIGRPLVVQGERGFSEICEPATIGIFLHQGFWGVGAGSPGPGARQLADQLEQLLADPGRREQLGRFGRQLVEDRFALAEATRRLADLYTETLGTPVQRRAGEVAVTAARAARAELKLHDPRYQRARGKQRQSRLASARQAGSPSGDPQQERT